MKYLFVFTVFLIFVSMQAYPIKDREAVQQWTDEFEKRLGQKCHFTVGEKVIEEGKSVVASFNDFLSYEHDHEVAWQSIGLSRDLLKLPSQSWQHAVGANIFLRQALGMHLSLVRAVMKDFVETSEDGVSCAWMLLTQKLETLVKKHRFMRRRLGLFALAAAHHLGNPIASIVLMMGLKQLCQSDSGICEPSMQRYFHLYDQHIAQTFQRYRTGALKVYLDRYVSHDRDIVLFDGAEVLHRENQLSPTQLLGLAEKGIPYYRFLHAKRLSTPIENKTETQLNEAFSHLLGAGEEGVPEAFYEAAELIRRVPFHECAIQTRYSTNLLLVYAAMTGHQKAFQYLPSDVWQKFQRYNNLFQEIVKFLKQGQKTRTAAKHSHQGQVCSPSKRVKTLASSNE